MYCNSNENINTLHGLYGKNMAKDCIAHCMASVSVLTNILICDVTCKAMYIVFLSTTNSIITAVLSCVVGHKIRQCCDCVVHRRDICTLQK